MLISRKNFIKSSSIMLGGVLLRVDRSFARVLQQEAGGFKKLKDNMGVFTGQGGTIAWFVLDDTTIVIDTQNPEYAKKFMDSFSNVLPPGKKSAPHQIDYVFNTHHHADHTAGNFYLRQFAGKILAQENCPVLQKKAYGEGENAQKQVYADTTFTTNWHLQPGKEKISAAYLGPAHTGGDAIYHFENMNIAHVGDLVFNRVYPFIDQKGGGSIKGWIEVLEKAEKKYSSDTVFICGHADTDENVICKIDDLKSMEHYFSALLDFVTNQKRAGKTLDEMKTAKEIPGVSGRKERWPGALAANIDAAYNELNG